MRRLLRENGLSIVWLGLFFVTLIFGQSVAGRREYNSDQREHGRPEASYVEYVRSAHFVEATMENRESEFLRIFLFVVLTACLYRKGSNPSPPHSRTGNGLSDASRPGTGRRTWSFPLPAIRGGPAGPR